MSDLDEYKAFRLNVDKFLAHFLQQGAFHAVITSHHPDRGAMIDALADAGIFPDDERRRGVIADACIALNEADDTGSTCWDKLNRLANALEAPVGPPWG